jgi:hypothetical protein
MMVGSLSSRMPVRRRLRKTAAIRGRSAGRAVSFSTMEARVTASLGVANGRPGWRLAHRVVSSLSRASHHALHHLGAVLAPLHLVGLGQDGAFGRRGRLAHQHGLAVEASAAMSLVQALGDGDAVAHDPSVADIAPAPGHGGVAGELVFAGLQVARRAGGGGGDEDRGRADDAGLAKAPGDLGRLAPLSQHDGGGHALFGRGAGPE